jgi:hypothetical protein
MHEHNHQGILRHSHTFVSYIDVKGYPSEHASLHLSIPPSLSFSLSFSLSCLFTGIHALSRALNKLLIHERKVA